MKTTIKAIAFTILLMAYQCLPLLVPPVFGATDHQVVVTVDYTSEGASFKINSKVPPPSKGFLLSLSEVCESNHNGNVTSVLMVHERIDISTITNVLGIMAKAGCVKPIVYSYSKEKSTMVEVTLSPAMPFTSSGVHAENSELSGEGAKK